ncbi:MAG: hypothetical protein U0K38_09415 [Collinsella sp.]|nr:hypothetical protein [Collinsella sp.]
MKTFDLKPCPFCGEAPTIRNGKWGNNELVIVCCESPQFFVMPATSMLMGHSIEEAAYAWNSRIKDGA